MPEGPELRLAAQFVNNVGSRYTFGGPVVKSELATKHQDVDFKASTYHVSAQSRGKEIKVFLQPEGKGSTCAKGNEPVRHLLFRFGMSGSFKFHSAKEEDIPKHAHLRFTTSDKKFMLSFVDYRRFGRWHINEDWGADRGPDIIDEYTEFRSHVVDNLDKADFDKAICEAMLNQKYFNGVGNYLRAEVLYRAGVAPFAKARDALQDIIDQDSSSTSGKAKKGQKKKKDGGEDLLHLCNIVMREVLELSGNFVGGGGYIEPGMNSSGGYVVEEGSEKESSTFNDWLQCYMQDGMKNLVDRNGRTIWFSGDPGPMKPANSKSRSPAKTGKKRTKKELAAEADHDYNASSPVKVKKEVIKQEIKEVKQENGTAIKKKSSKKKKTNGVTAAVEKSLTLSPLKTRGQRRS